MKRSVSAGNITLALTLIIVGGLALIQRVGQNTSIQNLMVQLLEFWPVILLLLGIEILAKQAYYKESGQEVSISLDGGSIFFLIIVVIAASSLHSFQFGTSITKQLSATHTTDISTSTEVLSSSAQLKLKTTHATNISLEPSEGEKIDVEAMVTGHASSVSRAEELAADVTVNISHNGDAYEIEVQKPSTYENGRLIELIELEISIKAPIGMPTYLENEFGDIVVIERCNDIEIVNRHGDILLKEIEGEVSITNEHGEIELTTISGNTSVHNRHGDIIAQYISGDVLMRNEHGNLAIEKVTGFVEASTTHGKISANQIGRDVNLTASYDGIEAKDIEGKARIRNEHGEVILDSIAGEIDVRTSFDDITINDFSDRIYAENRNGGIKLVTHNLVDFDIYAQTSYDDILLELQSESNVQIDGECTHGQINAPGNFIISENGRDKSATGKLGSGRGRIDLRVNSGDIDIRVR